MRLLYRNLLYIYILYKHCIFINRIYLTIEKSQIKRIYTSLNVIFTDHFLQKHKCCCFYHKPTIHYNKYNVLYNSNIIIKNSYRNIHILYQCKNDVSFLYDILVSFLYDKHDNIIKNNIIYYSNKNIMQSSLYLLYEIYTSCVKDTLYYNISSTINYINQKIQYKKTEIDYILKEIILECSYLYKIILQYIIFCTWSSSLSFIVCKKKFFLLT